METVGAEESLAEGGVASTSAVEMIGAEESSVEGGVALASAASSSRTSYSSSESLRMMMLPSLGGPRRSQLRSPNSFLVNSSSREVSGNKSSSSQDRSTTRILSEGEKWGT
jgi:hypothetical protein